jgi:hypothetical protein
MWEKSTIGQDYSTYRLGKRSGSTTRHMRLSGLYIVRISSGQRAHRFHTRTVLNALDCSHRKYDFVLVVHHRGQRELLRELTCLMYHERNEAPLQCCTTTTKETPWDSRRQAIHRSN